MQRFNARQTGRFSVVCAGYRSYFSTDLRRPGYETEPMLSGQLTILRSNPRRPKTPKAGRRSQRLAMAQGPKPMRSHRWPHRKKPKRLLKRQS